MATIILFFEWYYKDIPQKFYKIWSNYVWFWGYYFSLGNTLKTFFSPWKRLSESYGRGFNIERWLSVLITNLFSRFIGMFLRIFLILGLLFAELFTIIAGLIFFIIWPIFPLILAAAFIKGVELIYPGTAGLIPWLKV